MILIQCFSTSVCPYACQSELDQKPYVGMVKFVGLLSGSNPAECIRSVQSQWPVCNMAMPPFA